MTGKVFRMSCGLIAALLLVHRASAAITTTSCTPGTGTTCEDLDDNAECAVGETTCSCKANYKANDANDACIKILTSTCSADSDCTGVTNAKCDTGNTECVCKGGYKTAADTMTCVKVLGQACSDNAGCSTDDANSVCKNSTCQCKDYYKEVGNVCAKVLTSTCSADSDCTGVTNAKCATGNTQCVCKGGYKTAADTMTCDKVIGQTCQDNAGCTDDDTNSECKDTTCQCKDNYKEVDNVCAKENSAQSVVMSVGLFVVSLLVTLQISL